MTAETFVAAVVLINFASNMGNFPEDWTIVLQDVCLWPMGDHSTSCEPVHTMFPYVGDTHTHAHAGSPWECEELRAFNVAQRIFLPKLINACLVGFRAVARNIVCLSMRAARRSSGILRCLLEKQTAGGQSPRSFLQRVWTWLTFRVCRRGNRITWTSSHQQGSRCLAACFVH